ncbi:uncharacterized protein BXZ73DRAFT_46654, partial [Epithele typhae]|uniref:uncharacterized protein n=1 Tax=Epithele typhae TaxID=378194 RepID=UPI002008D308
MDDNLPPARKIVHTEYVVPLLRLACVCRRWRYLIVGASTLWSSLFVDVDREAALDNVSQLFHTRAAHAPLKVTLIVRQRAHVLELLPEWVAKLRSFQLKVVGLFPGHYSTLFPSGAPLLECLAISYRMDIPNDPRWRVDISNCIFGDGVTPLRALAIVPVQFDFPSDSFPHLTHLYLSLKTTNMQAYDLTGDVLKLLSRTPQLQYLHISSVP